MPSNSERQRNCVKSSSLCMLHAGKSVACACYHSRKEKCEFVEIQWAGRTPKSNKGKARATTRSPSLGGNPDTNSGSATPVPATSPTHASPKKKSGTTKQGHVRVQRHRHWCTLDCLRFFELAQLKQVYRQLQSRYRAVQRDQRRLYEVVTQMEHVMGKVANWAMQEDIHFSIGPIPQLRHPSPTPGPPMTDFIIDNELCKQSFNPTIDNIFFDFDVLGGVHGSDSGEAGGRSRSWHLWG
ncbi:hypothetical protein B0H10DRAFT_1939562 [Mycena sp. CBHHK59/15]|nr:hypothetical protein B0H10DRAFT_1939562 [Mycena sp. CBHHK59/15]